MRDTREIRSRNNKVIIFSAIMILALMSTSSFLGGNKAPIVIDLGESIYDVANSLSDYEEQYTMGDDWLKLVCTPQSDWLQVLNQKKTGYYEVRFKNNKVTTISWYDMDHVLLKENLLRIHCKVP